MFSIICMDYRSAALFVCNVRMMTIGSVYKLSLHIKKEAKSLDVYTGNVYIQYVRGYTNT